jgi:hypothetical protein
MSIVWETFLKDKRYLKNVSSNTISDYECAWRACAKPPVKGKQSKSK